MTTIKGILIPADELQTLSVVEFDQSDYDAMRNLVGGDFAALDLSNPDASIFYHDEGKNLGLPLNRRATLMLWIHHPSFRGNDVLMGDVLVLGPANDETGETESVPDKLIELIFHTPQYRYLVKTIGENGWNGNGVTYDNWVDAYNGALSLAKRWTLVEDVTVVTA